MTRHHVFSFSSASSKTGNNLSAPSSSSLLHKHGHAPNTAPQPHIVIKTQCQKIACAGVAGRHSTSCTCARGGTPRHDTFAPCDSPDAASPARYTVGCHTYARRFPQSEVQPCHVDSAVPAPKWLPPIVVPAGHSHHGTGWGVLRNGGPPCGQGGHAWGQPPWVGVCRFAVVGR